MRKMLVFFSMIPMLTLLKFNEQYNVPNQIVTSQPTELEKFLSHMAQRESNNTPHIVNRFGMLGKYQFSPSTIRILGFRVTPRQFLKDPELQDSVMVAYLRANNKELNSLITKYENKVVKGVRVTRSGVLAAAHLAGSHNVKLFFHNSDWEGKADANGTSIREYMKTFSIYRLVNI